MPTWVSMSTTMRQRSIGRNALRLLFVIGVAYTPFWPRALELLFQTIPSPLFLLKGLQS
jgi:hypothetical protein